MNSGFSQAIWSKFLISTLAQSGIRHAVVSPGSRSTPLVIALQAESRLTLHSIIDERSAAFFALGLAKASGCPVLLVCTSGTAAANYYPAIVEANLTGIPLVVLTADRPLELQFARAPQTIDQTRLYGTQVRRFVDLGEGPADASALRSFQRLVLDTVQAAQHPQPGPVHFNGRARKPLEPTSPQTPEELAFENTANLMTQRTVTWAVPQSFDIDCTGMAAICIREERGLILCGPDIPNTAVSDAALLEIARATSYPVWIDPAHPLRWSHSPELAERVVTAADLLTQSGSLGERQRPRVLIQLGPGMTNQHIERWLTQGPIEHHWVIDPWCWSDPQGQSDRLVIAPTSVGCVALAQALRRLRSDPPKPTQWQREWSARDACAQAAIESWSQELGSNATDELSLVQAVLNACDRSTQIMLGNSLPIREAGLVVPAADHGWRSYANRGANGIDGVLSTGAGLAHATGQPTVVLLGDISFLHDLGGLWCARGVKTPLALVVIDNGGGRIFEQLPVAAAVPADQLAAWTTPHHVNFQAAGALFGIDVVPVSHRQEAAAAVRAALGKAQCTLLWIKVSGGGPGDATVRLLSSVRQQVSGCFES